jgi:hypothetical protein
VLIVYSLLQGSLRSFNRVFPLSPHSIVVEA